MNAGNQRHEIVIISHLGYNQGDDPVVVSLKYVSSDKTTMTFTWEIFSPCLHLVTGIGLLLVSL